MSYEFVTLVEKSKYDNNALIAILKDGDVLDLGSRKLNIYHTPGHSSGHISIFDESKGFLFTGDLLYDETPVYAFYPTTNPIYLVNSLEKITKITNINMIYGSHIH